MRIDENVYNAVIELLYGYEEYVLYNNESYKEAFDYVSKIMFSINEYNELYNIIQSWKIHLDSPRCVVGLQVQVTNRCSLYCKHCYHQSTRNDEVCDLSLSEFKKIVDKFYTIYDYFYEDNQFPHMTISGGECTLNPEIKDIILYSLQRFSDVKILTNGLFLSDSLLSLYKEFKHKLTIQISVDGMKETHDYIRGTGSFDKSVQTIRTLLDNGIKVSVLFVANNKNYQEYEEVFRFLSKLGVKDITCQRYNDQNNKDIRQLFNDELSSLIVQMETNKSSRTSMFVCGNPYVCNVGNVISVDYRGNLMVCKRIINTIANFIDDSIESLINSIKRVRLRYRVLPKECFSCNLRNLCSGGSKCLMLSCGDNVYTKDKLCDISQNYASTKYQELYYIQRDNDLDRPFYEYCNSIIDRFGFFEKYQIHPLPQYNEVSLELETSNRVKLLGERNILWSGGVDSTYIVCAYIKEKIPFNVICDDNSVIDNMIFYQWMLRNNVNVIKFNNVSSAFRMKKLITGYLADTLFSFNTYNIKQLNNNISFYDSMEVLSNRDFLYEKILEYGKFLNKPTDTNFEIIKLLNFGMDYIHSINEIYYYIFPKYNITSFFNTKSFSDIAYTQYWYRTHLDNKPEMHNFICDVTQDDRMKDIKRNRCKIIPRLEWNSNNYIIPKYDYE